MLPDDDDEAAWQLTGGGWLYALRDADRAGQAILTLLVGDLDERLAAAATAGIEPGPVETVAGSVRTTWSSIPMATASRSANRAEPSIANVLLPHLCVWRSDAQVSRSRHGRSSASYTPVTWTARSGSIGAVSFERAFDGCPLTTRDPGTHNSVAAEMWPQED